ncbi:hypothetical protein [Candidatus Rhabdochlamydia sp. T3358]|uniref:hypothetical protein n=1 Tax=Candidatus Rhabdochlamydia sp. T3358 TaxID=2099795 RepID=UPI0010BC8DB5|nr:hypothetical protein [Candidatus Rhabdochlamydia sp. T3358]VHO04157.1 hypothetical protein RHT_01229 [Candidatus Rhabdochlamydia sp. T3358]
MSSIATIMGLTSYNPYKEAITMLIGGAGPYLINQLTLKPTNIASKIDRIRETLFGMRTRFLELTQKNALTKYTWVFLKHIPTSLAVSKAFCFIFYLVFKMTEPNICESNLIFINNIKHLSFLLTLGVSIYDELNPSPPKSRELTGSWGYNPNDRASYYASLRNRLPENHSRVAWKDYSTPPVNLGQKSLLTPSNLGGFKAV